MKKHNIDYKTFGIYIFLITVLTSTLVTVIISTIISRREIQMSNRSEAANRQNLNIGSRSTRSNQPATGVNVGQGALANSLMQQIMNQLQAAGIENDLVLEDLNASNLNMLKSQFMNVAPPAANR